MITLHSSTLPITALEPLLSPYYLTPLTHSMMDEEMQNFDAQLMRKAEYYRSEDKMSIYKSIGHQKIAFIRHQGVRKGSL